MSHIPPRVRSQLRMRAGDLCEACGKPGNNAHHRKNRSQGGGDVLSNLMLLCGSGTTGCHGYITVNPKHAYTLGWSVHSYADPASRAVNYRGQWVLLADDGSITKVAA